jgi:hypothetical protein
VADFGIICSNPSEATTREFASTDGVVGIPTGYGLDDGGVGVRVPVGSKIFSSPRRPDRLWGLPSLLSNGYGGGGKAAGS